MLADRPFILAGVKESSRILFTGILPENAVILFNGLTSDRTRERFSFSRFLRDVSTARNLNPEIVIDTMGNRYSALFSFLSGADTTIGPDPADEFAALYSIRQPLARMPFHHLIYKPAVIASPLTGYDGKSEIVPFAVQSVLSEEMLFRKWNPFPEKPLVLLVPGAGWKQKQWGADRFRELAKNLETKGFRILLSGGPNEQALCNEIAAGIQNCSSSGLSGSAVRKQPFLQWDLLCSISHEHPAGRSTPEHGRNDSVRGTSQDSFSKTPIY